MQPLRVTSEVLRRRCGRQACGLAFAPGFTLIEVLVALAIIAFAFVGLLGLHARNIKAVARDQNLTRATLLARELVSQVQYQVTMSGLQDLGDGRGKFEGYPGYRWEREVHD